MRRIRPERLTARFQSASPTRARGVIAVLLVILLHPFHPALAAAPAERAAGPYQVRLTLPQGAAVLGDNRLEVEVTRDGSPARSVHVSAETAMPGMPGMAPIPATLRATAAGRFAGTVSMGMEGAWTIEVRVAGPAGAGAATFPFSPHEAAAPSPAPPSSRQPYQLSIETVPAHPPVGETRVRVHVMDAATSGVQVHVGIDMAGMPMGLSPQLARPVGAGTFEAVVPLSMRGLWKITAQVDGPAGRATRQIQVVTHAGSPDTLWMVLAAVVLAGAFATAAILTIRRGMRLQPAVFLLLLLVVAAAAGAIIRARWPADITMGMKMDMSASDMGMSARNLSQPIPVALETVRPGPFRATVTYSGTVVPYVEDTVNTRVTGWLREMRVYAGDRVREGEVVARLDDPELLAIQKEKERERDAADLKAQAAAHDTQRAAAALQEAREREKAAEADVSIAREEIMRTQADLTYQAGVYRRERALRKQEVASQEELEKVRADYVNSHVMHHHTMVRARKAQDDLRAARAAVRQAEAATAAASVGARAARAEAVAAQAGVEVRRVVTDYQTVRADTSGVVTRRLVDPGVLVQAGTPIYRIARIDRVRLQAEVAESDLAAIHRGASVTATSPALGGRVLHARVTAVFHAVDAASRTGTVEAVVANRGGALLPGDFVSLRIVTARTRRTLSVATRALVPYYGKPSVWVAQEMTGRLVVRRRTVQTGRSNGERTEIRRGLEPGERVVWAGLEALQEDSAIVPGQWGTGAFQELVLPPPPGGTSAPSRSPGTDGTPAPGEMPGMEMRP